jgi:hypothetical protein
VLDLFMKRENALGAVPFLGLDLEGAQSEAAQPVVVVGSEPTGAVDEVLDQLQVEWME